MSTATATAVAAAPTATGPAAELQGRARRLRARAASLDPVLAATYRRRAAELDLEALLEAVWNPPIDMGDEPEGTVARTRPLHVAVA